MAPEFEKSDMEGQVWPPIALGDNAILVALLAQLERTERLSPQAIDRAQSLQLEKLFEHHLQHSPHFAARFGKQRPKVRDSGVLRQLQPLTRRDVQSAGSSFFARQVPRSHLPLGDIKTSGSTGEPVAIKKTAANRLSWAAFNVRQDLWHKRDFRGRMSAIRANVETYAEQDSWGFPVSGLFATGKAQLIPIAMDVREQLKLLARFRPTVLLVYPSHLAEFAAIWEKEGFKLSQIDCIRTIGETVSSSLRARVKAITGLIIEDNYSSQEVGMIAIQCPDSDDQYHVMSEALIVEILSDKGEPCREGEIGRVVVTDLQNFASPMIRYDIGDYAQAGSACTCGRGLPTLSKILGRERNLLTKPDGTRHWPITGFHQFSDVAPIRQYQFVQKSPEDIDVFLVVDTPLEESQRTNVVRIIQTALGYPFHIKLMEQAERLTRGPNGKFEEFVNLTERS
jgi:phenylacetate-CoA ligase